jgi:hypothetical protein
MVKRFAVVLVLWFSIGSATRGGEGDGRLAVDGHRTKAYVAFLSSDAMQGRMACTAGYRQAAEWAAARFQEWGLKPAGENGTFYQKVKVPPSDWHTGIPSLTVNGRAFPLDEGDYAVLGPSTPATVVQAAVVFVGYGISAPQKGLDEYHGVDVTGKIVLALMGSPKDAPQERGPFAARVQTTDSQKPDQADEWKDESSDQAKIRVAYDKKAAAILLFNPDDVQDRDGRRGVYYSRAAVAGDFKPEQKFLSFMVRERVWRAILKRDPQESPWGVARRVNRMRNEIKQKRPQSGPTGATLALTGYEAAVRFDDQHGNNVDSNVLAKIEGTDPKLKAEYVIVGAHLDHIGARNGYVYNGADDNASGSAVVLEIARVLASHKFAPKRTLLFGLWCAEERGLIGSLHYTRHPCDGVDMDKVTACFNLDMVGMGDTLPASGALNFPTIWEVIKRNQDSSILSRIRPEEGGPGGSDHTGFIERGIETMMLLGAAQGGHPDYHQPEDDVDKIEPEMLRLSGQFVLQGMVNLAQETQVPLLVDRRQELYRGMRTQIRNANPDLKDSQWSVVTLTQTSKEGLYQEIHNRARELFRNPPSPGPSTPRKSLAKGLANIKPIGDDRQLLQLVLDLHGIGRVDLKGDDGVWIVDGRLSEKGKEAVKTLAENAVAIRLISPGQNLTSDLLSVATEPFIITGQFEIPDELVDRLNQREVRIGIDLDPKNIEAFLTRLEKMRKRLGERKNLFAYLTSIDGLNEAKRPLYLGLVDRGWSHNEISGGREHRGLLGGGNLDSLLSREKVAR